MTAYLFVHSTITDAERFARYREESAASVSRYGGKLLIAGAMAEALEGTHTHQRAVVFEFPDAAAIRAWYACPEYVEVAKLRAGAGAFDFLVVEPF